MKMPSWLRFVVFTGCMYECIALGSGKVPTLTEIDGRSRHVLGTAIVAALAAHFYLEGKPA